MQIQTVLDPQAITRGQSEAAAQRRLELAAKAVQDDDGIEFLHVVHRALMALRLSKAQNAPTLLEQLYDQHPSETIHQLVARIR